jgi:hypothetical protein
MIYQTIYLLVHQGYINTKREDSLDSYIIYTPTVYTIKVHPVVLLH